MVSFAGVVGTMLCLPGLRLRETGAKERAREEKWREGGDDGGEG